jgi:phosphoribosylaminoimidazole (AIR) synthetase
MGVGMVVIVPPDVPPIVSAAGIPVWRIGEVVPQSGTRRVNLR